MGWGGKRPNAGRKPKSATVLQHPSVPTTNQASPIEEFEAPDDLMMEERAVWLKQAPHAFKNRTLSRASAMAFERYCKVVVLERNEAKSSGVGGANHRGLLRQVNELERQFLLVPDGRPLPEPQEAASKAPAASGLSKFR